MEVLQTSSLSTSPAAKRSPHSDLRYATTVALYNLKSTVVQLQGMACAAVAQTIECEPQFGGAARI